MTHVLIFALRDVLVLRPDDGENQNSVQEFDQNGALVDESKLRFDFSWDRPLSESQLARVEQVCSDCVKFAVPVESYVAAMSDAQKISSLRAVSVENYPDPVRVVSVSSTPLKEILSDPSSENWFDFSVEFCGGTHLTNTSEAGEFVLLNEEGIAKGVRRITAVTMLCSRDAIALERQLQDKLAVAGKMSEKDLEHEIKKLTVEVNRASISASGKRRLRDAVTDLSKRVIAWKKEAAAEKVSKIVAAALESAKKERGNRAVCRFDFGLDGKVAKSIITAYSKEQKTKALLKVTADVDTDKFMVVAAAPRDCQGVDCKVWVTAATAGLEAKGVGKADGAQFHAAGLNKIDQVLEQARAFSPYYAFLEVSLLCYFNCFGS